MIIKKFFLAVFIFTLLSACASAEVKQATSSTGAIAPDFTLPDQDGKLWTIGEVLKNYHGVVLAFYPKDDTGL